MADTALVTGASSGIGLELAKVFAANGFDLVLVARGEKKLSDLAAQLEGDYSTASRVIGLDLSRPEAPDDLFRRLHGDGVHVDVLVNNAGFAQYGKFADTDPEMEAQMLQLNIVSLTRLTKLFLPAMTQKGSGRVLNVASTAAFQPGPLMAVYYASKAYVLFFSEALAEELRGTGVTVTALCPGPTRSGFQARAAMEDSRLVSGRIADASDVARAGFDGLMAGKPVVVPGVKNKLFSQAIKFAPRSTVARIVHRAQERT
jgi:uncharacterized protein